MALRLELGGCRATTSLDHLAKCLVDNFEHSGFSPLFVTKELLYSLYSKRGIDSFLDFELYSAGPFGQVTFKYRLNDMLSYDKKIGQYIANLVRRVR